MADAQALNFVDGVLKGTIRREQAQAAVKNKLRGKRLLLETPRDAMQKVRRKKKGAAAVARSTPNRTERRALLLEAAAQITYEQLLRQHDAWLAYAEPALLGVVAAEGISEVVSRLDWHGARVRVVRSACTSHADAHGLVLTETRRMLLLLSETRRAWIPKAGTTLELTLPRGEAATCEAARAYPPSSTVSQ